MGSDSNMAKERENRYLERKSFKRKVLDYVGITVSAFLYAVAISLFLDPNSLAPGGVTGISIILSRLIPIPTGTLILLLNIPILILGTWKFGVKFIMSTLYCIGLVSLFTNILSPIGAITQEPILAALAGSCLVAVGVGGVFKSGATTGGVDIIIKVLRLKYPHLKTGSLFLIMDTAVVTLSAFVFKDIDRALYAGLAVIVTSLVLDMVLYGRDGAKMIYIISDKSETIAKRLLDDLGVGVTYMQGSGAYSGKDKKVIMCIMRKQLSPKAEDIIKQEDPQAFMIVTSATEIYGEGYKNIFSERL